MCVCACARRSARQSTDLLHATPHINRLADGGVRLASYYGQPSCTPARATLLAGAFVHRLGFQDIEIDEYSNFSLPLRHKLLPARLRAIGCGARPPRGGV